MCHWHLDCLNSHVYECVSVLLHHISAPLDPAASANTRLFGHCLHIGYGCVCVSAPSSQHLIDNFGSHVVRCSFAFGILVLMSPSRPQSIEYLCCIWTALGKCAKCIDIRDVCECVCSQLFGLCLFSRRHPVQILYAKQQMLT